MALEKIAVKHINEALRNSNMGVLIRNTTAYVGPELERRDNIDLLIEGNRIAKISSKLVAGADCEVINGKDYFVTPGLVNSHIHPAQQLNRALGFGLNHDQQMDLLHATDRIKKPEDKKDMSYLAVLEGLKTGTTCFQSVGSEILTQIPVYNEIGVRAVCIMIPKDIERTEKKEELRAAIGETGKLLKTAEDVHLQHQSKDGLVRVHFGVVNTTYASDELLKGMLALAEKYNVYYHAHEAEGNQYVEEVVNRTGHRPVTHLYEIGALNHRVSLAHMTKLSDEEIKFLAEKKVSVVCCPRSNTYGRVGICPVDRLIKAGVNVCLASDAAINDNSNSVLHEAHAIYDQLSTIYEDSKEPPIDCITLFRMLTINGAKAMGIENDIGTIEEGKKADLVLWSKNELPFVPGHNYLADLVFNDLAQAHTVMVDGKIVLENHKPVLVDEKRLIRQGRKIVERYYRAFQKEVARHLIAHEQIKK